MDFYVLSGRLQDFRPGPRSIREAKPACRQCGAFQLEHDLSVENATLVIVSNLDGRSDGMVNFSVSLLDVPSCMDRCFVRPLGFVGAAMVVTSLVSCALALSRPLARDEKEDSLMPWTPWDEAWVPQVLQCSRPAKPSETCKAWILHACILTYPWHPWNNDPLEFGFRCLVLVVSLGLTLFVSTLYGDIVGEWDFNVGIVSLDTSTDSDSPDMVGVMLCSMVSLAMETILRVLALSIFRCSLTVSRLQQRRRMKVGAMAIATAIVATCIIYPLTVVLSKHVCGYVQRLFTQFLFSEAVRGFPLSATVAALQYFLLQALGRRELDSSVALSELQS